MTAPRLQGLPCDPWTLHARYDALRTRHTALVAALDALVAEMRDNTGDNHTRPPRSLFEAAVTSSCADRLAAELAAHRKESA